MRRTKKYLKHRTVSTTFKVVSEVNIRLKHIEERLSEELLQISKLKESRNEIIDTLNYIAQLSSLIKRGTKLRLVFLVHHIGAIDALLPIIQEANKRGHEALCISINNNFSSLNCEYSSEEIVHQGLEKLGIPHLRFGQLDSAEGLSLLKTIQPDYIFKQSPWDNDVEYGYRSQQLLFTRVCYTPYYGIQITQSFGKKDPLDFHTDQNLHRKAYAIFIENSSLGSLLYKKNSKLQTLHVVRTGLPKYEHIQHSCKEISQNANAKKVILWCPHHSFEKEWLNFGTFHHTYKKVFEIAKTGKYKFIFRPHPVFKHNIIRAGLFTTDEYEALINEFLSFPETEISTISDPMIDFNRSDLLLSDGISFLASYQVTGKPVIWLENNGHAPLSIVGERMSESLYVVKNDDISQLEGLLTDLLEQGKDPLQVKRKEFVREVLLGEGKPSEKILDFLEEKNLKVGENLLLLSAIGRLKKYF